MCIPQSLIVEGYFSSVIEKNSLSVTYGYNATALVICLFLGTNFIISLPDCTLNILYEIPHPSKTPPNTQTESLIFMVG